MEEQEKIEEVRHRLEEIGGEYGIDQIELGKLLIVVSASVLMVSIPAAMAFHSALGSVESTQENMSQAADFVQSSSFQSELDNLVMQEDGDQFLWAYQGFQRAGDAAEGLEETSDDMEERYTVFQWISLLAILGLVSGITIIYL